MKHLATVVISMLLSFALNACDGPDGPDGYPGTPYFSINITNGILAVYTDSNPSIPDNPMPGRYYPTMADTYTFEYESRVYYSYPYYYYARYTGWYRMWQNPGGKGGSGKFLWREGDRGRNGADSFLTLYCDFNGPSASRINKSVVPGFVPNLDSLRESGTFSMTSGEYMLEGLYQLGDHGIGHDKNIQSVQRNSR